MNVNLEKLTNKDRRNMEAQRFFSGPLCLYKDLINKCMSPLEQIKLILVELYFMGGGNAGDISYSTNIPEQNVKRILKSLEKQGLVKEEYGGELGLEYGYKHFYLTNRSRDLLASQGL